MKSKLVVLLTLLITITTTSFADESFATIYPEDTAVFVEFNNTEPANSEFHKTNFAAMLEEPQVQKFFSHAKKKFAEIFYFAAMMTQGIKVDDLLTAFGNHVAFGLYTDKAGSNALLVAEFPKNVNPLQMLAQMNPAGPDADSFDFSEPIDNLMYFVLKIKGQKLYAAISMDKKYLDSVVDKKTSNLTTSADFIRASSQIGSDRLVTAYMSPSLYQVIQNLNTEFQMDADLSLIPSNQFSTIAFGISIDGPAFVQRTYFKKPTDSFPYEVLRKPDMNQLCFVPTNSTSAALIGVDIKQGIEFIMNKAVMSSPQALTMSPEEREKLNKSMIDGINNAMNDIKNEYGVNPLEDIIEKLGNQMTFCSQGTDNLPGLELFGFGGNTIIANVKNKEDLAKSLDTAINSIVPKIQDQAASKLEIHTDFGTIKGISLANAFTICYIIVDDNIVFALNPSAIEYTLNQRKAKQNFLSSPKKKELMEQIATIAEKTELKGEPIRVAYMNIDGISDIINNTVALGASISGIAYSTFESQNIRIKNAGQQPQFTPFPEPTSNPSGFIKYLGEAFPMYLLPSKNVINKHIFDAWTASYITPENEFIDINYGPFPIHNMLFSKDFGNFVKASQYAAFGAAAYSAFDNYF